MNARIKESTTPFELNGTKYNLVMNFNVIEAIQEEYGDFDAITERFHEIKVLKFLLTAMINEAVDIHNDTHEDKLRKVTAPYVGRYLDNDAITRAFNVMTQAMTKNMPQGQPENESERPSEEIAEIFPADLLPDMPDDTSKNTTAEDPLT